MRGGAGRGSRGFTDVTGATAEFIACVALFATGHWIGGTVMAASLTLSIVVDALE